MTIEAIAAGGNGVGRLDGLAVFVPRTAPGDVVQAAIMPRGRYATGRVLQILSASADRVAPACPHYEQDRCGGCQLQHLSVEAQQRARRLIVQETLQRIGRREVPLPALHSEQVWGYRGRLTLTLIRRRQGWIGGLHPYDDPVRIFPLDRCPVSQPVLVDAWHIVRARLMHGPAFVDADRVRLGLRVIGERHVAVVVDGGREWPTAAEWAATVRAPDAAGSTVVQQLWWRREDGRVHRLGEDHKAVDHAAVDVEPSEIAGGAGDDGDDAAAPLAHEALAFAQVNRRIAATLQQTVLDAVRRFAPTHVVDAYAGTGGLARRLAESGCRVTAIEADAAGVAVARRQLEEAGVSDRATMVHDTVEAALPQLEEDAEVLVINPPRRGVDAAVCAWLESPAARGVRGVVYISCDPATLARDLARLPSWCVRDLACYDMFPQTAHVETVCVLARASGVPSDVFLDAPQDGH